MHKTYGKNVIAVDGISFTVKKGEIFVFLGPNGAGKSITIKILTTFLSHMDLVLKETFNFGSNTYYAV